MNVRLADVRYGSDLHGILSKWDASLFPDTDSCEFLAGKTWAAWENDELLGYIHVQETGFINRIAVRPPNRRQGVATRLLRAVISYARRYGPAELRTYISRYNVASVMLFLALGFRPIDIGDEWWQFAKMV